MITKYQIPSHCEFGIILDQAVMLVFSPIVLPFKYKVTVEDADDFWVEYCANCSLRGYLCRVSGALSYGTCKLGYEANSRTVVHTVQMPVPRHVLFMDNDNLKFAYEHADGQLYAMRMSNIYSDGTWCAGRVNFNNKNPTSIYNGYFNSIHNQDLSPSDYAEFITGLVNGTRTMDYDSQIFKPELMWGTTKHIVQNPLTIEWSNYEQQDFFAVGYRTYVKIS